MSQNHPHGPHAAHQPHPPRSKGTERKAPDRIKFLPVDRTDLARRGWDAVDAIIITGDAYVDHPSFGSAVIGRVLEDQGWRIGIIAQPRWDRPDDFLALGRPRLCCMVTSGNLDSMVAHYTAALKKRSSDAYSPGGAAGKRPDRAVISYCNRAKQAFGADMPLVIGGLEASLRKLSHYDVWSDTVRRSLLLDAKADLLVYGMGELQSIEIMRRLARGERISELTDIPGTVHAFTLDEAELSFERLPSHEAVSERDAVSNTPTVQGRRAYAEAFSLQMKHANTRRNEILAQRCQNRTVYCNPPAQPLPQEMLDRVHELPYQRAWHPSYDAQGGVPALAEVKFGITSNRGCFGSCSFCAITSHQGRTVTARSVQSLVRETRTIAQMADFRGIINDLGGPTANFQGPACSRQARSGPCGHRECLFPRPCPNLQDTHGAFLERLEAVGRVDGVRKVFIRSGIRYDYLLATGTEASRRVFLERLARDHVSGQLKIAPEHVAHGALQAMGKPEREVYEAFLDAYGQAAHRMGKDIHCIPYFIAGHPGSTIEDAIELAVYLKHQGFIPDQVQEFYPTPGTVATCMYYTGLDPRRGEDFRHVHVPKGREKHLQRALLHFHKPENRRLVLEALRLADRMDLAGMLLGR